MFAEWADLDFRELLWNTDQQERRTQDTHERDFRIFIFRPQDVSPW
jgi:hypothetical protein